MEAVTSQCRGQRAVLPRVRRKRDGAGPSQLSEVRKTLKPLMEKRRRARINESLNQLKGLILEAPRKDSTRYSKLEKADILEMTVKHLQSLQKGSGIAGEGLGEEAHSGRYGAGFHDCVVQVARFVAASAGPAEREPLTRLLGHLLECLNLHGATARLAGAAASRSPSSSSSSSSSSPPPSPPPSTDAAALEEPPPSPPHSPDVLANRAAQEDAAPPPPPPPPSPPRIFPNRRHRGHGRGDERGPSPADRSAPVPRNERRDSVWRPW